jgi:hypothetical protein
MTSTECRGPAAHHVGLTAAVIAVLVAVAPSAASFATTAVPAEQAFPARTAVPLEAPIDDLDARIASARAALASAEGRVLDDAARSALASELEEAAAVLADARAARTWPLGAQKAGELTAMAADAAAAVRGLDTEVASLEVAVGDWEAEQDRIAAEQEAARVAAERARPAAAGAASGTGAGGAASGAAHVEQIWTAGGQGEIDACRGSVDVPGIASYLGAAFYAAEHWSCGGSTWSGLGAGALVEFPGYGVYRVAGVVSGLAYGSDASAIPAGYAGYYQTCIGGSGSNMAVWLLAPA